MQLPLSFVVDLQSSAGTKSKDQFKDQSKANDSKTKLDILHEKLLPARVCLNDS